METVFLPRFLFELPDMEIFLRVEMFMNLSVKFCSALKDRSIKTLRALTEHRPMQDLFVLNEVLDLLKDVVLGYERFKLIVGEARLELESPKPAQKVKKQAMFSKADVLLIESLHSQLRNSIAQHEAVMAKLRKAHTNYMIEYSKLDHLMTLAKQVIAQYEANHPAQVEVTPGGESQNSKTERRLRLLKKISKKQHAELTGQNDTTMKALVRRLVFVNREKELRERHIRPLEAKLRTLIEDRISQALSTGCGHLTDLAKQLPLSQSLRERLEEFDAANVASKLYQQMATRYMFPEAKEYDEEPALPETSWMTPDFRFVDKQVIRLGSSGSSADLLSQASGDSARRREELYVWSCVKNTHPGNKAGLKMTKGQRIKQKFCSMDGQMAFGWSRIAPGAPKTYGCYPTSSVSLVQ